MHPDTTQTPPRVTRPVVVIAHGSPSHPVSQDIVTRDLAFRLQAVLPGTKVHGATLADTRALPRVMEALAGQAAPILCPWFMSDGWFVGTHLPKRLRAAGLETWHSTDPLGLMPGIDTLMQARLAACINEQGWSVAQTTLILAAHGSPSSDRPRLATEAAAQALARRMPFKSICPCFVDEPPAIRDAARVDGPAILLPFFAARAGHVVDDLPAELDAAAFTGPVLDPLGVWAETPALAATHIRAVADSLPSG